MTFAPRARSGCRPAELRGTEIHSNVAFLRQRALERSEIQSEPPPNAG